LRQQHQTLVYRAAESSPLSLRSSSTTAGGAAKAAAAGGGAAAAAAAGGAAAAQVSVLLSSFLSYEASCKLSFDDRCRFCFLLSVPMKQAAS